MNENPNNINHHEDTYSDSSDNEYKTDNSFWPEYE